MPDPISIKKWETHYNFIFTHHTNVNFLPSLQMHSCFLLHAHFETFIKLSSFEKTFSLLIYFEDRTLE